MIRESKSSIDFHAKNVPSSICGKFWARCKNVVFKYSSDSASTVVSTDNKNGSDGPENERETNRKSHPAIDDVYEEIMNCLRSKLMLKYRYIMSNDEKKYIGF